MYIEVVPDAKITRSLNQIAASIANNACEYFYGSWDKRHASATTFALFVKHVLRNYIEQDRTEYSVRYVVDTVNTIAQLSGYGFTPYDDHRDFNNYEVIFNCYAFAESFREAVKNLPHPVYNWQRCSDSSVFLQHSNHGFFLDYKTPRHYQRTLLYEKIPQPDGELKYVSSPEFPNEMEARLFLAELVIKLNQPWLEMLSDICGTIRKTLYKKVDKLEHDIKFAESVRKCFEKESLEEYFGQDRKHVYCFEADDGTVKIGVSRSIVDRKNAVQNQFDVNIRRVCCTEAFPSSKAFSLEKNCHEHFADNRAHHEFFNIPFKNARDYLATLAPIVYDSSHF